MSSRVRSVCAVGALAIADQFFFKSSVSNGIRIRAITPTPRLHSAGKRHDLDLAHAGMFAGSWLYLNRPC